MTDMAPTRSGKGISFVMPVLYSYPGRDIILDFEADDAPEAHNG